MKDEKTVIFVTVLSILILFLFKGQVMANLNINEDDFEDKRLGLIIKINDKFIHNYNELEKSYLNRDESMPTNEEAAQLSEFIKDYFKENINMEILKISNEHLLNKSYKDYKIESTLKKEYNLDYLCIINLSYSNFHYGDIVIKEGYPPLINISYLDNLTINYDFNINYSVLNDRMVLDNKIKFYFSYPYRREKKKRYSYSVLVSYKLIDLIKYELIYSEKENGIYKTNVQRNKMELMEKSIVNALEKTSILKESFKIRWLPM